MAHSAYQRVSRKRVCLICGKPDWCSYTPDEKISFCARIIEDAARVSRTGWGVFYHQNSFSASFPISCHSKSSLEKAESAPIEIRDFAYRKLIELAPATDSEEIINGKKGLRARKILNFENYGSLPPNQTSRTAIARKIRCLINQNFPDYVRKQKSSINRVPGFWLDITGKSRLWQDKDFFYPLMLIPYRNKNGLIEACQIRFMGDLQSTVRYVWLSMPDKANGLSSGSPLHFAGFGANLLSKPFLITEGALKAETVKAFKPDLNIFAAGGVNCSREQIISATRFCPIMLGFDNDYKANRHVARAIATLIFTRFLDSIKYEYDFDLKILTWQKDFKGIDDALLQDAPLCKITPPEWFDSLSKSSRKEVELVLGDYKNSQSTSLRNVFTHLPFSTT